MAMKAEFELDAGAKTFASGLMPELIAVLRRAGRGDLIAVVSGDPRVGADLEAWCRFTHNSLVEASVEVGRNRWVVRCGKTAESDDTPRAVGSRLWLYT